MFFELHSGGERAVLVQIAIDGGANEPDLGEFIELLARRLTKNDRHGLDPSSFSPFV